MRITRTSTHSQPHWVVRYGVAISSVAAALLVTASIHTPLFIPAILVSAWYGGHGPGLLAVGLSMVAVDYSLLAPRHSMRIVAIEDAVYLIGFMVTAIFVALLTARQRRAGDALRQAHDELSDQMKELEQSTQQLQTETDARKQAAEALQQSQAQLAHVTRVTMLGEITASIAHEVNQPLAAVVMNGNACLRWLATDPPNLVEARESAQRIVSDGNRAGQVIARVRALVKGEPAERKALDVNDVITDTIGFMRGEVARQNISMQIELGEDLPAVVGDRVQLQQVLVNLILNALDAMAVVIDRPRMLTILSRNGADSVFVEVRDSGTGLASGEAARVFDPFFSTKPGGLGIGLSVTRSIVEQHGGKISPRANDGPGVTMQVSLPAAPGPG